MSLDTSLSIITNALQREQEAGQVNNLDNLADSQRRRELIDRQWEAIQKTLAPVRQEIADLPSLPPEEQILWAQTVLAMRDLAFMEIDTTGLEAEAEIIRFTLLESNGNVIDDFLIKPERSQLRADASRVNGITPAQLARDGIPIAQAWERIQAALIGRYVISFAQDWDIKQLNACAERHNLPPILVIGDDLKRHCFAYYHREYSLTLGSLCERIGHPLTEYPHQTSLDRAKGQRHLLAAISNAVTDMRPPKPSIQADTDADSDALDDIDGHPF